MAQDGTDSIGRPVTSVLSTFREHATRPLEALGRRSASFFKPKRLGRFLHSPSNSIGVAARGSENVSHPVRAAAGRRIGVRAVCSCRFQCGREYRSCRSWLVSRSGSCWPPALVRREGAEKWSSVHSNVTVWPPQVSLSWTMTALSFVPDQSKRRAQVGP